ncbi:MAG: hypothetical protein R2688_03610 [Fimbriimonadaceae bacterium]
MLSLPFIFEGPRRKKSADAGATQLEEQVDTLIVIPNDRLNSLVDRNIPLSEAFRTADDVLRQGVQGISDIITRPGLINVDFADVKTVMSNAGIALMGMGYADGDHRAKVAAEMAANSPLLKPRSKVRSEFSSTSLLAQISASAKLRKRWNTSCNWLTPTKPTSLWGK